MSEKCEERLELLVTAGKVKREVEGDKTRTKEYLLNYKEN
jgi:hypothetical protein